MRRAPTLLYLLDLPARARALEELLGAPGAAATRKLVQRTPSLLAYDPATLRRKLGELGELFPAVDPVTESARAHSYYSS